jgi:hypothetical protein
MYNATAVNQLGLKFALLAAFALPASAGFIIPPSEWGSGGGTVSLNVNNYHGNTTCSLSASVSTCTQSIASNLPPNFLNSPNGTASGTLSASVDGNGAHLYAEAGVSGQADSSVNGYASFYDTVYNPTATAKKVQFTFHLDAELYTLSSTVEFLQVDFNQGTLFQQQQGYGGAGTYSFINQELTTPVLTVAANSYANWNIVLSTTVVTDSSAGSQYLAGYPTGFVDAGNTLSFTGISVSDAQENPLTASGLTSYAGFDYTASSTSSSTAPEPATVWQATIAATLLFLAFRVARRTTHDRI